MFPPLHIEVLGQQDAFRYWKKLHRCHETP
jgi:hypothetical protein